MAKEKKEKYKGGPKMRSSRIKSIAKAGKGGRYLKYGDIGPEDVHEGDATYRGFTVPDSGNLTQYSRNVFRGHGKEYFIHRQAASPGRGVTQKRPRLYKSDSGSNPEIVKV